MSLAGELIFIIPIKLAVKWIFFVERPDAVTILWEQLIERPYHHML